MGATYDNTTLNVSILSSSIITINAMSLAPKPETGALYENKKIGTILILTL